MDRKLFAPLIFQNNIGIGIRRPGFVAAEIQIDPAIVVYVNPAGAADYGFGQFGQRDNIKGFSLIILEKLYWIPGKQIEESIVVEITEYTAAFAGDFGEAFP